jgi:hypothetical protein
MSLRLIRVVAVWLVVLGVSPFTAPFSTCDPGIPVGESPDRPSELWVKPATDSDKAPVALLAPQLATPLSGVVAAVQTEAVFVVPPPNRSRLVLRI